MDKWQKRSKGRGRGTSNNGPKNLDSPWKTKPLTGSKHQQPTSQARFDAVQKKQSGNVKAILEKLNYDSSSEEDDINEEQIFSSLTKLFPKIPDGSGDANLGTTTQYLTECLQSGALTCLVCISSVKRLDKIWHCDECYSMFHLQCIKQWVLEGVAQATLLSDEYFPNRDHPWYCPKCRNEYKRSQCPEVYKCFCGDVTDPENDPWVLPHSCGGTCNNLLQNPKCGHKCLLLCHPGPCPPCPQTIKQTCFCEQSLAVPKRCGSGKWSCGNTCNRLLDCGKHSCKEICHDGKCPPCTKTSVKSCVCGSAKQAQPCSVKHWTCEKKCGKMLTCGQHLCEKLCHAAGQCGTCPRQGVRTCPCGKQEFVDLSCSDDVTICVETCEKNLGCDGNHKCPRRCHFGDCGQCPLMVLKRCRCGNRTKELPCHKSYTCETKCTKTKACGKHACKRKCCTGNCPSCEQICNKTLQCKRHKCQMTCHHGPCYPCPLTSNVTCRCGGSVVTVVCGKQNTTKPPRCRKRCEIPPDCHHTSRISHACHFGDCPKCKQICNLTLKCSHICPAPCHDRVIVKNESKASAPWEAPRTEYFVRNLGCPPCSVPVTVVCRGRHETGRFPCSEARDYSCGLLCGRALECGNHKCAIECHVVREIDGAGDSTKAGSNCSTCEEGCSFPRPPGCIHKCDRKCHRGDCSPCHKHVKKKCHCGLVKLEHLCCEWAEKSDAEKTKMGSCGGCCPKILAPCKHPCPLQCHAGECPSSDNCKKKVNLRCLCKRRKKEFICSQVYKDKNIVHCDEVCQKVKAEKEAEIEEKRRIIREEEEKKQKEEIEKFERKIHKKSRAKRRKSLEQEIKPNFIVGIIVTYKLRYVLIFAVVLGAMIAAYYNTEL